MERNHYYDITWYMHYIYHLQVTESIITLQILCLLTEYHNLYLYST